jgi:hypothetical protein
MSDTETHDTDRTAIRKRIRKTLQQAETAPRRASLTDTVARTADVPEPAVSDELDALEREGFVYLVGDGDDAEVKLP